MKNIQHSFSIHHNTLALVIGLIIILFISCLFLNTRFVRIIGVYPWSVQISFVSMAVGIICFSFSPKKLICIILFLFAALPGKIFVEPFSLLYRMHGIWIPLFTPVDILLLLLGAYSIPKLLLLKQKNNRLGFEAEALNLIVFLFIIILSSAINFATNENELFFYSLISALRIMVMYIAISAYSKIKKDIKLFLFSLIFGMVVQSIYSLLSFRNTISALSYSGRLGAPGLSVNSMGALAALFIPILFCFIFYYNETWQRIILIISFLIIITVALLTQSRAGLIGIIFGMLFSILLLPKTSKNKAIVLLLSLCTIFYLLVSKLHIQDISRIYRMAFQDPNILSRLGIWVDSISLVFKDFLKLLLGYGVFGNRLAIGYNFPTYYDHAHNILIQIFFEGGILGLALWLYMIFSLMNKLKKIAKNSDFLGIGLVSGIFGFIVASMFDYTLWEQKAFLIFWSFIIVSIRFAGIMRNQHDERSKRPYITIPIKPVET